MVKKKGKSKRTTLKDKYKIQRRVVETNRKRRKQAKRDAKDGVVHHKRPPPDGKGIPNSWPFKQDLLKEIQRSREKQQQLKQQAKDKRKQDLRDLQEHMNKGGKARTVQELMEQANKDRAHFENNPIQQQKQDNNDTAEALGQPSRRAYLRELKKVIDTADVLLQVLDARDPIGTRIHPSIEEAILSRSDKKMVLVLNKIDLIPKDVLRDWLTHLRKSHPTIAIQANHSIMDGGLLQLLKNYARINGEKKKTTVVAGVIGYPNVGKSSLINAMERKPVVGVSPKPGFTTSMQEVVLDRHVRLLDSPGVVFDDRSALLGNCVETDPMPAIEAMLHRCHPAGLMMMYNIPAFPRNNAVMFLAMVAKSYGRVLKGGIPDKMGAARAVLQDWNSGKIPYYTPAPKDNNNNNNIEDAVVVSSFGKEFDVYDKEILDNLKDRDEMDFVPLEEDDDDNKTMTSTTLSTVKYLAGDDENDDGDDEMEESDEVPSNLVGVSRKELSEADDFFTDD